MDERLMILPAQEPGAIRLIRVPEDLEHHEAYRYVTGIIAAVEESDPHYRWSQIAEALEDRGFEIVETMAGPTLD